MGRAGTWRPSTPTPGSEARPATTPLNGFDSNDTLFGDLGNDTFNGGNGNDTYVYRSGDGADIISESVNSTGDVLQFTNLNAADVMLRRSGNDLYVK